MTSPDRVKVYVDSDEWYPVYSVVDSDTYGGIEVEVPQGTLDRWQSVAAEFEDVQNEMEASRDAAKEARR